MESNGTDGILDLLHRFQDGYTRRDLGYVDEFMKLFSDSNELEVIGTNAVEPGTGEWCRSREAVRDLVAGDWEHWGDLVLDIAGAHINISGDVGWLAAKGQLTDTIPHKEQYQGYLAFVKEVLEDEESSDQMKTLDIVALGNDIVSGLALSETYVWPFRFTAVVVRDDGHWRFHQMQFSFATTGLPDERYL